VLSKLVYLNKDKIDKSDGWSLLDGFVKACESQCGNKGWTCKSN
jgi:hypothetical protein